LNREAGFRAAAAAISTVAAGTWGGGSGATAIGIGFLQELTVPLLHESLAVALVGADGTRSLLSHGAGVTKGRLALELGEDGFLMSEKVAHKFVSVLLLKC
jgi:L-aminopeptidase/D-esterase-like protein